MHHLLEKILKEKQKEVARLKNTIPPEGDHEPPPKRDFRAAISVPAKINLIAEIKFASPSAGLIHAKTDPVSIGRMYEKAGAAAISLLTDKYFFQGDLVHLPRLKKAIALPILRKDFIIDEVPTAIKKIITYCGLNFARSFIYCVAGSGVTGEDTDFSEELTAFLTKCREATQLPLCL